MSIHDRTNSPDHRPMPSSQPIFWMSAVDDAGAPAAPRTAPFHAPRCDAPRLDGDRATLAEVLRALRQVGDRSQGHNIVDGAHILALRVDGDEAELALSFPAACGTPQRIADDAFQALRRLLPERDIYVTHPR